MRKCVVLVGLMVLGNFAGSRAAAQQDGAAEAAIQKLQLQAVASLDNDRAFRQTVRRFRRLLGDRGFEPLDAIRVDVAVESGVPRFSWPGENRFESYSLAQILNGPITEAGSLTLHIRSFLLAGEAKLEPRGEEQIAGRAALGFELDVAAEKSRFTMRVGARLDRFGGRKFQAARGGARQGLRDEIQAGLSLLEYRSAESAERAAGDAAGRGIAPVTKGPTRRKKGTELGTDGPKSPAEGFLPPFHGSLG